MRIRTLVTQYKDFIFEPGTLVTLLSGLLLVTAIIVYPAGMFSSDAGGNAGRYLYLAAAAVGSLYIWWSAVKDVLAGDFTADVPVSIATAAAILIGQYPAAAVVAVLLLVGGLLEDFVAARADNALEALAKLLPDRVTVRRDGKDIIVPRESVVVGDLILVRPGERIAVDGIIVSGSASINQAAITGESLPVEKQPGESVFAGTLAEAGAIEVKATKAEGETTLGQIRKLIVEAREQKPPIERMLDTYAKFYTPIALILGGLLWWWSGDAMRAITVLIVFCPCVMVLATPTALVASIGNAALRGSLVKKGATIEALAGVDTVVFDKTGTLTMGKPKVVEVTSLNGMPENELIRLAAMAEKYSEHPVGRAIVTAAMERGINVEDPGSFQTYSGLGVMVKSEGREILLGRLKAMADNGVILADAVLAEVNKRSMLGRNVILIAIDNKIAGIVSLEDEIRPESGSSIETFSRMGLHTIIVTGDNIPATERVASALGIEEIHAEILPSEKVEIVKGLQARGHKVAFVGDGVNDGPALATANVGIAMGLSGTDVAIETADIGLLSDDLSKLPHLMSVSRRAIKTIKQNVAFAVTILAIAVILTIPGILSPVSGALLHELSSIPVIMNSARIISYGPKVR